jgi:flavorubredoxin
VPTPDVPTTSPQRIAPDTWLVPNLVPAGPGQHLYVNTMVVVGEQPVVVDTGAPLHRDAWLEAVGSIVDPADVRWIFLSHDDGDHIGNLRDLHELAPAATVVANFFSNERARLEPDRALPLDRMVWLDPGDVLDVGDRRMHLVRPPIYDGPTTRGLLDDRTGVLWAADAFAAFTPGAVYEAADLPADMWDGTFPVLNSLVSPWHEWLDPAVYGRHVDAVEALGATTIASCHGPVLRDGFIADAFARVRAMAGQPAVTPPGQGLLDELVAGMLAAA